MYVIKEDSINEVAGRIKISFLKVDENERR
jgi:hypothetical protein